MLVAFIDTGVDIFHSDFRKPDTSTRIKFLLDFSEPGDVDGDGDLDGAGPYGGTLYTEAEINTALGLGSFASVDETGHGTHGLSVAAGDDGALPGEAPEADLLVVKATRVAGSLGFESVDLLNALAWVEEKATELGQPMVVNLSLGTMYGAHDGSSLEEQAIDALAGPGIAGRVVVAAAGNSADHTGTNYRHFTGESMVGVVKSHGLEIPSYTATTGKGNDRVVLSFWHEGRDANTVRVKGPAGCGAPTVTALFGDYADVATSCGDVFIANMGGASPLNGDVEGLILIDDWGGLAPVAGAWTIEVEGSEVVGSGEYHGWLLEESSLGGVAPKLTTNADNDYLIGKPGSADQALTVGSYALHAGGTRYRTSWTDVNAIGRTDSTAVNGQISGFSSSGPTRDGRVKPEVAAPGERVEGAVSREARPGISPSSIYRFHPFPEADALLTSNATDARFGMLQGTSFAAPVVTGIVARILEIDPTLDAVQVRNIVANSSLIDSFVTAGGTRSVPNGLWGYGKLDRTIGSAPLPSDLKITVDQLPDGVVGQSYSEVLTASGGTLPYAWSTISGTLPPGITRSGSLLSGTPTTPGTYAFTIQVEDDSGPAQQAQRAYAVEIFAVGGLTVETTSLLPARIGQPYEAQLEASGGSGTYTWNLAGGTLPIGLALAADGTISGTPTLLGKKSFTVEVDDGDSLAYRSLTVRVTGGDAEEWAALGKDAPLVSAVEVDPNDSAHVVAATNLEAVFESFDGGESWEVISRNRGLPALRTKLAVGQANSTIWVNAGDISIFDLALYWYDRELLAWIEAPTFPIAGIDHGEVGRLELDSSENLLVAPFVGQNAVKSTDMGATWNLLGLEACGMNGNHQIRDLEAPDAYADHLWVTSWDTFLGTQRICFSDDAGNSWFDVTNGSKGLRGVGVSAIDSNDVVIGGYGPEVGLGQGLFVERSVDAGRTWSRTGVTGLAGEPFTLGGPLFERSGNDPTFLLMGRNCGSTCSSGTPLFVSRTSGATWEGLDVIGPLDSVWALDIDPADDDVIWVSVQSGLHRSIDGGQTWSRKMNGLALRALRGIAVSSSDPAQILLVSPTVPYGSRSGGDGWTLSSAGLTGANLRLPVIAPEDPNRWYVVTDDGLFRTDNAGVTWAEPNAAFEDGFLLKAVDADPFDLEVILASSSGSRGTFRSLNGGETWAAINTGLPLNEARDLSFARDVQNRALISFTTGGVYRTENLGTSWSKFPTTLDYLAGLTVSVVEPAPTDSEWVYAVVGSTIYRRAGSGQGWQAATTNPSNPVLALTVDPTNHLVAYAGADHPGTVGNQGGIYKTTNGGVNWTRLAGVLDSFDVVSLAHHPTASGFLYAATADGGVYRTLDGGSSWELLDNYGTVADLVNVNVEDPSNPALLLAGTEGYGVQASTNQGQSYVPRVTGLTNYFVNAVTYEPGDPAVVYAATDNGLFKSVDSGNSWSLAPQLGSGEITDVIADTEGLARRVWATVAGEGVAYSPDAGVSFATYASGLDSLALTGLELEVHSGTARRVWATSHGGSGVLFSDDLGQSWQPASGNGLTDRDVNDLKVAGSGTARRVWATTDNGVYVSGDLGLSWSEVSAGLPSGAPVTSAAVDPNTGEVLVSLFGEEGGGVYRGGSTTGVWKSFNSGLGDLRVRRLTSGASQVVDGTTNAASFYASTSGDGVYAAELRATTAGDPTIVTSSLPSALERKLYLATATATGGLAPYQWSLADGALPPGLELDAATGAVSGLPTIEGIFPLTMRVADANQRTDLAALSIAVLPAEIFADGFQSGDDSAWSNSAP